MHFNDIIGCTSHEIKYSIKIFKKRKREKKEENLMKFRKRLVNPTTTKQFQHTDLL